MKPRQLLPTIFALGAVAALGLQGAQAESPSYSDLEKRMSFDKSPIKSKEAAVASYAPALEKVMPAVVTIASSKSIEVDSARRKQQEELFRRMFPDVPEEFFDRFEDAPERKARGLGSGVIISPDGYILTNNHVVSGADTIEVTMPKSEKKYDAEIVGADPRTDVALIKIDAKGLDTATVGDSSNLRIGDVALAVGSPLELEQTATLGIVSAVGRDDLNIIDQGYENFIQTDAAINRGNSGGALVDAKGRLVGINTAIQSNFTGGNIGIGFAIPSNMALDIVKRLLEGDGTVKRGFLGVYLRELDENFAKALGRKETSGVLVTEVGKDTPAAEAGMKPGDLIVGYAGEEVDDMNTFRRDVANTAPGTKVTFEVIRDNKEKKLEVTLGDLEKGAASLAGGGGSGSGESDAKPRQIIEGVDVRDLDADTREALQLDEAVEGIVVESVKDNSTAFQAGLRPGTVITQIDQTDVSSVEQAYDIVDDFDGDVLLLQVYMAGRRDILAVPLEE